MFILLQLMMPWALNKFSWPKKMFWATFRFTIRDCSWKTMPMPALLASMGVLGA